jgi:hypothetical protein
MNYFDIGGFVEVYVTEAIDTYLLAALRLQQWFAP